MPTIRLIPSSTGTSHSSYASVQNAANMYYNTDHTANYASCRGRNQNSTTAYYIFIKGFNFSDVPADANVTSFSVKIRCYRSSNERTGANYRLRLASSGTTGSVISNTTLSEDIGTTTGGAIYTFPTGSLTWAQLSGYGGNFSIVVPLASTSSSRPYVYVYGAEIEVNYTVPTYHNVTVTNNSSATVSPTGTTSVLEGNSQTITFTGIQSKTEVVVTDNNVDVTNSLVAQGGGFQYTISNVSADHTITVEDGISTWYTVNASSTYTAATVSPATQQVGEGRSGVVNISLTDTTLDMVVVTDNNVDVTNQLVPAGGGGGNSATANLGTFDSQMSSYVGIYSNHNYTNAEGNSAAAAMASTSTTRSSFYPATGDGQTILIAYNIPVTGIPSNAIITNVYCSGAVSTAYAGSGYSFTSLQLYAGSTPKGSATEYTMTTSSAAIIYVSGGSSWTASELAQAKLVLYGIRNDHNSNNDNTGQRDNVNMHGATIIVEYDTPTGDYTYTINNIQTGHTVVVSQYAGTTYTVTASSTYTGATISPASTTVRPGHDVILTIVGTLNEIVVKDNGTNVTSQLVGSSGVYTYTVSNIQTGHTVVVEEATKLNIQVSSLYPDATGSSSPTAVYPGGSSVVTISLTGSLEDIVVTDNNVDVTNQLVPAGGGGDTASTSGVLGTFDSTNSVYDGIYSSYAATNAEGHGSTATTNDTRSSFYVHSGSGNEMYIFYNFGSIGTIPAGAVITNVSCVATVAGSYSGDGWSTMTIQLYAGTTPKGTPTDIHRASSAGIAQNVDGGSSWTLSEIANAKICMHGIRNDVMSDAGNEARDNLNIYGADLVVTYSTGGTGGGDYTYTLSNIQVDHAIVIAGVSAERDYVKVNSQFKTVRIFYKKVSGSWQAIAKADFDDEITSKIAIYGGDIVSPNIGEVTVNGNTMSISIDDNSLPAGNYHMVYEDSTNTPMTRVAKITDFTIS